MAATTSRAGWARCLLGACVLATTLADGKTGDPSPSPDLTEAQKERLKERDRLAERADKLKEQGKFDEAVAAAEAMLKVEREVLGGRHRDVAETLERLAQLHEFREDWEAALRARRAAVPIRSEAQGAGHWQTIDSRWGLKRVETVVRADARGRRLAAEANGYAREQDRLFARGAYSAAVVPSQKLVDAYKELLGQHHPDYALSLANLAVVYQAVGKLAESQANYEQALSIRREALGERHPAYAENLNSFATLLRARGDLAGARAAFERALAIRKEILGERHPDYAESLQSLALQYKMEGDFSAARPLYERALALCKELLGERHPDTLRCISNMAGLLRESGDLAGARRLLERTVAIRKEVLGEEHPSYLNSVNALAALLKEQGDLAGARPLAEEVLVTRAKVLGKEHPDYAIALNNMAVLLRRQGDLPAARRHVERALAIQAEALGKQHPDYAATLDNLGVILRDLEDAACARDCYERSHTIRAKALGPRHLDTAHSLHNLALLLQAQKDFDAARSIYEQVRDINVEVLGGHHPAVARCLEDLATVAMDRGEPERARELADSASTVYKAYLADVFPSLPEREQLGFLDLLRAHLGLLVTLGEDRPETDGEVYRHLLARKGLTAESASLRAATSRPEVRALAAEIAARRTRLNGLYYARVPAGGADARAREVRQLTGQLTELQARLAREVGWKPVTTEPARVAAALPEDAALIDILRYSHYGPFTGLHRARDERYAAFVIRRGVAPKRVDLGRADEIDEAIASWTARFPLPGEGSEELGRDVARRVWDRLSPHVGGVRVVLVSPDGETCRLPWGALPDPRAEAPLLRRHAFGVVISARHLLALAGPRQGSTASGLFAVGGVDYGRAELDAEPSPAGSAPPRRAPLTRGSVRFDPLPATQAEVEAVAGRFRRVGTGEVVVLTGARATKERVAAAMKGRLSLHLATHGFFAPPESRSALAPADQRTSLRSFEGMGAREVSVWYPGLLSGLAWAGAADPPRHPGSGALDLGAGLMTAEEVAALDLNGCDLAVLSACETGLGRTALGEGVLGLQRAFHQAGCRTVVASLWKVNDAATMALMTRFYTNLWENGLAPLEALRQAQLSVLDDPEFGAGGDPRLWAAWTLSGDPGGLPRLAAPAGPEAKP